MPDLPSRRINNKVKHNTYKLKDFIGKNEEFIKTAKTGAILVDYETVINNIDLLRKIIVLLDINQINCLDYESAIYLEEHLKEPVDLSLVDDYQTKDRSYIDTTKFTKHKFYIPLSYFMWGIKFNESCNIYCMRSSLNDNMFSSNGDTILYKDTLLKIKEIINSIQNQTLSDLDKYILVSNYIQSKVQYVESGLKSHADKVYIIDANPKDVTSEKVGSIETVINENYGLCMAIANTTTLLLNNPIFKLNVRSIYGDSHVWNIVTIDNKTYYIDNTWAITRNKNRVEEALKATSFSSDYLLFGLITANNIGHHNSICYSSNNLETADYNRKIIKERVKVLSKEHNFTNYPINLRFKSRIEK